MNLLIFDCFWPIKMAVLYSSVSYMFFALYLWMNIGSILKSGWKTRTEGIVRGETIRIGKVNLPIEGQECQGENFRTDPVTANKWTFWVLHTARLSSSSNTSSGFVCKTLGCNKNKDIILKVTWAGPYRMERN